jgi:hypothetical protein
MSEAISGIGKSRMSLRSCGLRIGRTRSGGSRNPPSAPHDGIRFGLLARRTGKTRAHRRRENGFACAFTSPRVRGEGEEAQRPEVRGPLRDSEWSGGAGALQILTARLGPAESPPPRPSPRARREGEELRRTPAAATCSDGARASIEAKRAPFSTGPTMALLAQLECTVTIKMQG